MRKKRLTEPEEAETLSNIVYPTADTTSDRVQR
jgi:hypothetical protein